MDIRHAVRLLRKDPLFTVLTVVVLAGGLGVSVFTWSFLYTAMLRPLPVAEGDRVVRVLAVTDGATGDVDAADLARIRSAITTLTTVGAFAGQELIVGTGAGTRAIRAAAAEWNVFAVTRTVPALGRGFVAADQAPGAERVVVLSHRTWRVVFGGDSTVLNRNVTLNGVPTRVIGIMPAGFEFPVAEDAWVPMAAEVLATQVTGRASVGVYARLAPGRSASEAEAELSALLVRARRSAPADPDRVDPTGAAVRSFPMAQIGEEGPLVLAVLNVLAGLILLLACINVTNLLLARANERARETAVRLALGAPRGRLVMQTLWESVILCVLGGMLAAGVAVWGLRVVDTWARTHLEGNLAFWWVWGFDPQVLLATAAFVTLAVLVLGGVASRRAVTTAINAVLVESGTRGGGRREGRAARLLIVAQVATVSVVMFVGCMAAIVAYRVVHVDLGYDTRRVLSVVVEPPADRYPAADARQRFFQRLADQLGSRSEVEGVVLRAPLADAADERGTVAFPDRAATRPAPTAYVIGLLGPLSPLGIGLEEGRFFGTADAADAPSTAIVSRAFARLHWPGRSAIGRHLSLPGLGAGAGERTVVGVVNDVLFGNPLSRDRSAVAVYVPLAQTEARAASVMFRHRGNRVAAHAAFQQTLSGLDPLVVPGTVASFDEMLAKTTALATSVTRLFAVCFAFALLLAVTGVYGLMARSISRRIREIGVRRALGATDRTILLMLLGQGGRQLGVGALVALPLTLLVAGGFSHFFPIALTVSVGTAFLVLGAITVVVLAATWLPTRRAIRVEPRDALWREG